MAVLVCTYPPQCGTGMGWLSRVPQNHPPADATTLVVNDYPQYYKGYFHDAQLQWFCRECARKIKHRRRGRDVIVFEFKEQPAMRPLL